MGALAFAIPIVAMLGALLIVLGLAGDRARGRRRCPACWYDLSGASLASGPVVCPECGRRIRRERALLRTRRRWAVSFVGLTLLAGAAAGHYGSRFAAKGWSGLPPVVILVAPRWAELDWVNKGVQGDRTLVHAISLRLREGPLPAWEQYLLRQSLRAKFRDPRPTERSFAAILTAEAWRWHNTVDPLVPLLEVACFDKGGSVAYMACDALARIRPRDPAYAAHWERVLKEMPGDSERSAAAGRLRMLIEDGHPAPRDALLEAVRRGGGMTIHASLQALAATRDPVIARRMGRALLTVDNQSPRHALLSALADMGPDAADAVPYLLHLLLSRDEMDFKAVLRTVGDIGPPAACAVPILCSHLRNSPERDNRHRCADALGRIGIANQSVFDSLAHDLDQLVEGEQEHRLEALFRLGWRPAPALRPVLENIAASGRHEAQRLWADLILAREDNALDDRIPKLIQLVSSPDDWESRAAMEALTLMGPRAAAALPTLDQYTREWDWRGPDPPGWYWMRIGPAQRAVRAIRAEGAGPSRP
jgi:hypothetical protein